jgi:hypothetical protein
MIAAEQENEQAVLQIAGRQLATADSAGDLERFRAAAAVAGKALVS